MRSSGRWPAASRTRDPAALRPRAARPPQRLFPTAAGQVSGAASGQRGLRGILPATPWQGRVAGLCSSHHGWDSCLSRRPVGRREPSRSAGRPLMAPAGMSRPLPGYADLPYRLSETERILYARSAYLGWTHQVATSMSSSFARPRHSVAGAPPVTLQSHRCYVVPQTSR